MTDHTPFFSADAEQILQAPEFRGVVEWMRDQNLSNRDAPDFIVNNNKNTFECVCEHVCVFTRVWLSTKVTSAQKFEMDIAMVFPLKPSEGFPIIPTLRGVITQS